MCVYSYSVHEYIYGYGIIHIEELPFYLFIIYNFKHTQSKQNSKINSRVLITHYHILSSLLHIYLYSFPIPYSIILSVSNKTYITSKSFNSTILTNGYNQCNPQHHFILSPKVFYRGLKQDLDPTFMSEWPTQCQWLRWHNHGVLDTLMGWQGREG